MGKPSQKSKLCKSLSLPKDFEPRVTIAQIFQDIALPEIIDCLRTSESENGQIICALFDRLARPLQEIVTIDYLIAAAFIKDPHIVAGLITETYSRTKAIESTIIAARESPGIMTSVSLHAKKPRGFRHAQMVLQTTGVVATPRNQTNYIIGNRVDNSKNVNVLNVPAQHEVVNEVSKILEGLPDVPSREDIRQNPGNRKS